MALENEPLDPVKGPGGQVHVVHFPSPEEEVRRIAEEALKTYLARPTDKHLVLVTRRKWGYELRAAIRDLDSSAPVETIFAEDVLESWPAREAFIFLSILADPDDPVALRDWVSYQEDDEGKSFKAPRRNAAAYLDLKSKVGVLTIDKLLALRREPVGYYTGTGRGLLRARIHRLIALLDAFDRDRIPAEIVTDVFDPERWIDYTGPAADLARDDLGRLLVESHKLLEEDPDLAVLGRRLRYRIATREPLGEEPRGGIRIVTLWGAKGLTADWVWLVGLCDEALPGPHDEDESGLILSEHLAEQRRLLYVSLTRARKCLVISRASRIRRGVILALGLKWTRSGTRYWQDLAPCQFFEDIPRLALPASVVGASWTGVATD
jgi:superfamily I DNA/RNA helicase